MKQPARPALFKVQSFNVQQLTDRMGKPLSRSNVLKYFRGRQSSGERTVAKVTAHPDEHDRLYDIKLK